MSASSRFREHSLQTAPVVALIFLVRRYLPLLLACIAILASGATGAVVAAPSGVHTWKSIEYPLLPLPGTETENLTVLVRSGSGEGPTHLSFTVLWSGGRDAALPEVIADATQLVARLHLSDGEVILPKDGKGPRSWNGSTLRSTTYSMTYSFPWQRNAMDEAWIELGVPGQIYWIELPYGFTRDPAGALPVDDKRSEPAFPPTMKSLGEKDKLVPSLHVNYDLGRIQNGWRLSLELANPFDAQGEAILYRDDGRVGESMYLWKLDTPRTEMEIKTQRGNAIKGRAMGVYLHQDGMRRSDEYFFNRCPEDGRDWGTLVIRVDEQAYECLIPSSLFKYVHGVADPGNAKRLPRPERGR